LARHKERGPDGRFVKASTGVGALLLALWLAVSGGGLGGGAAGGVAGSGSSAAAGSSGSGASASRSVRAKNRSQDGTARRLSRAGREVHRLGGDVRTDCGSVSYGRVRDFFVGTPCVGVGRASFEVREGGARVVVAVAAVEMPGTADAMGLKRLVDTYGTGNVRELRTPRGVRWTGRHYTSGRDDVTVVNAQAEPIGASAVAARLADAVARDAARS
jgi:hypothetical protein